MSFMTPILTVSSEICACAASIDSVADAVTAAANAAKPPSLMIPLPSVSNPEIFVQLVLVLRQFRVAERIHHPAVLDDVMAVRDRRGEAEILFDQQHGKTLCLQRADQIADLLHDDRGEPLGRFVEQQQAGAGAQDATDRQHLLLAA